MSTIKWQRVYKLQIETTPFSELYIDIQSPFTVEFNIVHSTGSDHNSAHFTILNLGPNTRKKIFQDKFDAENRRRVIFSAGYGQSNQAGIVFIGDLLEAYSVREGVDIKTELECLDGMYGASNGVANICFPPGVDQQTAFREIISTMPRLDKPVISPTFTKVYERGLTVEGNSWDELCKLVDEDGEVYLFQNHPVILKHNECITGQVPVITGESGLLDSPRRQEGVIEVKTLFEPGIILGQIVQLESMEAINNGTYKIQGYTHSGTISESVCDEATTVIQLYIGAEKLNQ